MKRVLIILSLLSFFNCAVFKGVPFSKEETSPGKPLVNVKIPLSTKRVVLSGNGFVVKSSNNTGLFSGRTLELILEVEQLPVVRFNVKFGNYKVYENAVLKRNNLLDKGIKAKIRNYQKFELRSPELIKENYFFVESEDFENIDEASECLKKYNVHGVIDKYVINTGKGRIVIKGSEAEDTFENPIYIYPQNKNDLIRISSAGENIKNLGTRGFFKIDIDENGDLKIINRMEISDYLLGVVSAEMNPKWHTEALKAQAVLSRTLALSKIVKSEAEEQYFIEADVTAQVFNGLMDVDKNVHDAVNSTEGQILIYKNSPVDILFSSCCGGVSSSASDYWTGSNPTIKENAEDLPGSSYPDISDEKIFKDWIKKPAGVFCNTKNIDKNYGLSWEKDLFRWESNISDVELGNNVKLYLSQNIGKVIDVEVIERYPSGNLKSVNLLGIYGELKIENPMNIRKIFNTKSAKFYIEKQDDNEITFKLYGAGSGHGCGLCQLGALGMALKGYNYEEIIKHYYKNILILRVY